MYMRGGKRLRAYSAHNDLNAPRKWEDEGKIDREEMKNIRIKFRFVSYFI